MPTETAIGDLLIREGVVDQAGLSRAPETQKTRGIALTEAILELGLADENSMVFPTIASVVKYFLELEGFNVLVAKDGMMGLAAAKKYHPHVIVTDYDMPEMDGATMVRALRTGAETRDIAVLMLTSESSIEKETTALEAGVDDYIQKPVEPRRLAARVKSVLARAKRRPLTIMQ